MWTDKLRMVAELLRATDTGLTKREFFKYIDS